MTLTFSQRPLCFSGWRECEARASLEASSSLLTGHIQDQKLSHVNMSVGGRRVLLKPKPKGADARFGEPLAFWCVTLAARKQNHIVEGSHPTLCSWVSASSCVVCLQTRLAGGSLEGEQEAGRRKLSWWIWGLHPASAWPSDASTRQSCTQKRSNLDVRMHLPTGKRWF